MTIEQVVLDVSSSVWFGVKIGVATFVFLIILLPLAKLIGVFLHWLEEAYKRIS